MLISYLQSVRAPLPISDFSAVQVLIIVAGTYTFFLTILLLAIYFPVLVCRPSESLYRDVRLRVAILMYNYKSLLKSEINQFALFHGSALIVIPTYGMLWISRASDETSFVWLLVMSLFGAVLGVITFCISDNKLPRVHKARIKIGLRVFSGAIVRGGWCAAWLRIMALLALALPIVRDNQGNSSARVVVCLFFIIITMSMYLGLTRVKARVERLPIVIFAGLFVALGSYPGALGKRTLHILGIGGGIPIKILLKTMKPESKDIIAQTVQGCLILNVGSRLILQPLDAPSEETCSLEYPLNEIGYRNIYKGVEVISSVDVIRVSRFIN